MQKLNVLETTVPVKCLAMHFPVQVTWAFGDLKCLFPDKLNIVTAAMEEPDLIWFYLISPILKIVTNVVA